MQVDPLYSRCRNVKVKLWNWDPIIIWNNLPSTHFFLLKNHSTLPGSRYIVFTGGFSMLSSTLNSSGHSFSPLSENKKYPIYVASNTPRDTAFIVYCTFSFGEDIFSFHIFYFNFLFYTRLI